MNAVAELQLIKRDSKPAISCFVPSNMLCMGTATPAEAENVYSKGSQVNGLQGICTNTTKNKLAHIICM